MIPTQGVSICFLHSKVTAFLECAALLADRTTHRHLHKTSLNSVEPVIFESGLPESGVAQALEEMRTLYASGRKNLP